MQPADNLYSQVVGWAKIVLPLCAIGLLSTLFLLARSTTEPNEIVLEQVEAIAREQRLSAPEFSGLTDEGAVIVISASTARPDTTRPDTISIDDVRLRMDNADGSNIEVTATLGEIDGRAGIASLLGLARLVTSSGYEMETNGLIAELDTGLVTTDGLLEIHAPFGQLTAGKVTFQMASEGISQEMLFTDGVRLLYTPQTP
ncbi:hypothetical protein [Yoonia sp.]|uniref:hypothetical protein n=1 Tax=Yoonia sp. TaxID=2212373 RepID=UPI00358F3A51